GETRATVREGSWRSPAALPTSRSAAPVPRKGAPELPRGRVCNFRAAVPDRHAAYASDQRLISPSFRPNEACDRALGYLRLCEPRSPRRHWWTYAGCSKPHSITSSTATRSLSGTVRPSILGV